MRTVLLQFLSTGVRRRAMLFAAFAVACSQGIVPPDDLSAIKVSLAPDSKQIQVGESLQLAATVNGNGSHEVTIDWSSSNVAVATVSQTGVVVGVAPGSAQIHASANPGNSVGTADVQVVPATQPPPPPPPAVATLQLSPDAATVQVGATTRLTATLRDAGGAALTGRTVIWSSKNTTVAEVDGSGLVSAKSAGTAQVIAASEGRADTALITVPAPPPSPVASVTLSADVTLDIGATSQLTATLRDAAGNVLTGRVVAWSSLDAAIADVNGSGLVTARSAGTARIVASSEGKADTARVTVSAGTSSARIDTIFYDGFESGTLALWQDGVEASHQAVRTNATFARVGSRYLEMMISSSETDAWLTRFFMPGYDSVYVRMYVRFPASWTGGTKVFGLRGSPIDSQWGGFGRAGQCANGTDFFSSDLTTERDLNPGPAHFYAYYYGMPSTGGCWGDIGLGRATYTHESSGLTRDVWHRVEYWVKLNAPASHDAIQRFWIDDVLWGEWTGISFRTTTNLKLNSLQLKLQDPGQSIYFDDILVTTAKPAP